MRFKWFCLVLLVTLWSGLFAQTGPSGIPAGYYDDADSLSGSSLKASLHAIVSNHTKYPYTSSSTDVWDILKASDEDPTNSDNVILLYTGRSQAKTENSGESSTTGSNRWNREHVWSKSHGFPSDKDTAYTDCHHIRPADESVNSSRNTLDFDAGGERHVEATDCFYDSDSWEPRDEVKGDVARMMFYMVVRYDPGYHIDNTIYDLELVDSTGTHTYTPVFGKLSTLLNWHNADPVDAFEQNRNEVVYQYQGNRNPFIDHPEWAELIFAPQLGSNTQVGFTRSNAVVDEDAEEIILQLSILNPDPLAPTTCDIVLTGGSGESTDLGGFTSESVIFAAGSSDFQNISIPITDDTEAESVETFNFSIQNVDGGDSALVNGSDMFVLTINASDIESSVPGIIISEVMDGNRSGGQPKFVEITNTSSSDMDISGYQIWKGSNGGDTSPAATVPDGTTLETGDSWVVAYNESGMTDAGFSAPDQTSGSISGNGNDAYELRSTGGGIIDVFGIIGDATAWYENSVAVRLPDVTNGQGIYQLAEWTITVLESGSPTGGAPGSPGTHNFTPEVSVTDHFHPQDDHTLLRTYPNPFNAETMVQFNWITGVRPQALIYDTRGGLVRELTTNHLSPGICTISWDGKGNVANELPSGVYILRVTTNQQQLSKKITLLR